MLGEQSHGARGYMQLREGRPGVAVAAVALQEVLPVRGGDQVPEVGLARRQRPLAAPAHPH